MKNLIVFYENGNLRTKLEDIPAPIPGPRELLIKVEVAGLNVKDYKHPLPAMYNNALNQGDDYAGTIAQVGNEVKAFQLGERVAGFYVMDTPGGTFAEFNLCPEHTVFRIPSSMPYKEASTIPLAAYTAPVGLYRNLHPWDRGGSRAPQGKVPLIVNGAGSAVGSYALKLASMNSLIGPVVATTGSSADYLYVKTLHPEAIIVDYKSPTMKEDLGAALGNTHIRFEYDLNRPYPFRWFTPVAVIGGLTLLVVFSFINLGANAFDTISVYTNDLNGTKSNELNQWYMKVPFNWGSTFKPDCEPRQLSVGDQFFTTNQGFYYILKSIRKDGLVLPSLGYLNTTLQERITSSVEIRLRKPNIQPDATMAVCWGSSELSAAVDCTVYATETGLVDLTMVLEFTDSDLPLGYPFPATAPFIISDNYTTRASVWWGTRLLSTHWTGVLKAMATSPLLSNGRFWMRGSSTYAWANKQAQQSIYDGNFFQFDFFLLPGSGLIATGENQKLRSIDNEANVLAMFDNRTGEFSAAAKEGLQLANVMHSRASIDLGNSNTPNYLLQGDALQNLLTGTDDYN
ncbi:hypothetical protein HDV63DRAFT_406358 [Trichoderma sp. SZMC 28014]